MILLAGCEFLDFNHLTTPICATRTDYLFPNLIYLITQNYQSSLRLIESFSLMSQTTNSFYIHSPLPKRKRHSDQK